MSSRNSRALCTTRRILIFQLYAKVVNFICVDKNILLNRLKILINLYFIFPITIKESSFFVLLYKSSKKIVYGEKTLYLCGLNLNILLWNQKAYQM